MDEVFLLMCYFGFSYADATSLTSEDREWIISKMRGK